MTPVEAVNFSTATQIRNLHEDDPEGMESDYESECDPDDYELASDEDMDLGLERGGEQNCFALGAGPSSLNCGTTSSTPTIGDAALTPAPSAKKVSLVKLANDRERKKKKCSKKRPANKGGLKEHVKKRIALAAESALKVEPSISKDCRAPITAPCWTVKKDSAHDKAEYSIHELCRDRNGPLMQHIEWSGKDAVVLVDREGRAFSVLGPVPKDAAPQEGSWKTHVIEPATEAIELVGNQMGFTPKASAHRRGQFPSVAAGMSHGGGQAQPSVLQPAKKKARAMEQLLKLKPFVRMAGHADCLFRGYAPRLHQYYSSTNEELERRDPQLIRPFPSTAFAACSVNFGPRTVAHKHRDYGNLTWGWCSITALGSYNYKSGGHLVLWDLNVVIDFPPGSTILLPSALLCHSNTSIAAHETRYSFTQYSAGALFRWADNGFQPQKKWASQASEADIQQRQKDQEMRWQRGLDMLSSLDELKAAPLLKA